MRTAWPSFGLLPVVEPRQKPKTAGGGSDSLVALGSALLYGVTAISMNFVNKATLMHFPYSATILLCQMVTGIVVVLGLKRLRVVDIRPLEMSKCIDLLPLVLLYNGNAGGALMSLRRVPVPVYSTVKRLTPMIVLGVKTVVNRKLPNPRVLTAVVMVVAGCVVAGFGDLSFDAAGYTIAFASAFFQATYLLLVEHTGAEKGVGSAELLLYNSVLSLPFLLALVVLNGEVYKAREAFWEATRDAPAFPVLLFACSGAGCLLNYSIFLCTMNTSALTTTIVGVLKGVLSTVLGFFLLGGVKFSWMNVIGIGMNTVGGVVYTVAKYRQKQQAKVKKGKGGSAGEEEEEEEELLGRRPLGRSGRAAGSGHEHAV